MAANCLRVRREGEPGFGAILVEDSCVNGKPSYEADDGPVTDDQIEAIRRLVEIAHPNRPTHVRSSILADRPGAALHSSERPID
jgi:hypothetical protein